MELRGGKGRFWKKDCRTGSFTPRPVVGEGETESTLRPSKSNPQQPPTTTNNQQPPSATSKKQQPSTTKHHQQQSSTTINNDQEQAATTHHPPPPPPRTTQEAQFSREISRLLAIHSDFLRDLGAGGMKPQAVRIYEHIYIYTHIYNIHT